MGMLKDKVIIVTGATSGMGEATARMAAREGAKVVLAARREEKGNKIVEEIKAQGGTAIFVRTDVTVEADVIHMVETAVKEYGRLDGAFNNAGTGFLLPINDMDMEQLEQLTRLNFYSVMYCMKHQINQMRKQGGGGSIVNCGSLSSIRGFAMLGAYTGTKHAVAGVTKAAALENAKANIRINALLPGAITTEIYDHVPDGDKLLEGFVQLTPMARAGSGDEIADPVCYLLSDRATFITGTELIVDGGLTAGYGG